MTFNVATKRTFEENIALAKARTKASAAKAKPPAKSAQLVLPYWPEDARRVANLLLRNALFSASKDREIFGEMRLVASLSDHTVKVSEKMNQHDLDNLEMLLHLQRELPLGADVEFTAHGFLSEMNRGTGGKDHKELHEDLTRLARATVEIRWTNERKSYTGSLVSGFARDEDTGRYVVSFNKNLLKLYNAGSTQIDWEQRQQLGKSNLAKWLQLFYASHEVPFAMKVETLREQSGSPLALRDFRRWLKTALDKLVKVGLLSSWSIENDLVNVRKLKKRIPRG